ncbi:MAG: hypothetical protein HYY16_15215 [Planctomycetes bacterium]|nr:hypothetical protein [Planctomycetota bacterium]
MGQIVSYGKVVLLAMLAGCAAPAPPPTPQHHSWRLAEHERLTVLERAVRVLAHFEVRFVGHESPRVGQPATVEVWVPGARPHERHRFRVRPSRPGVRLLDCGAVETQGSSPGRIRFTSESPGPGGVIVEPEE